MAGRFGAGKDVLYYSDLHYELSQSALFGEATLTLNDTIDLTAGLRYYNFNEDRTQVFDGIFADPGGAPADTDASGVAPRLIATFKVAANTKINAQVAKGFRLGGINDPLNAPLCTPQDLGCSAAAISGGQTAWNYELGSSRASGTLGSFNVSAFYMDVRTSGHGPPARALASSSTCPSAARVRRSARAPQPLRLRVSTGFNDSQLRSTVTSTASDGSVSVVAGIEEGNRLPSVPQFQAALAATYQWSMAGGLGYVTGTYQHVGSRYTQVGDEDQSPTLSLVSLGANTIGRPLTQATFTFDPEMPACDLFNLRLGCSRKWDFSLYANNLTDEQAYLPSTASRACAPAWAT
jgi:iron complex outermembrane receptor protein